MYALYIRLLVYRHHNQVLELLEELVLSLLGKACFQIVVEQLDDLYDDVFLILIDLWRLRLLILVFHFIEFSDPVLKLAIHLSLHKIVDCNELEDLEEKFTMLNERFLSFQFQSV